ncbi:MAG: dNTP triphosphohydrolase [Spirochaetales bacterium]|nr:dNTP triphosphohydrolase [Spirochaetales bacterium]
MNWELLITCSSNTHNDGRDVFQRDHDRLIFSSLFRSLNQKTQVFPMPENYFIHNRMTHSIETSCVGRSLGENTAAKIAERYKIENSYEFQVKVGRITETACLAHDIGNPPFGHSGEAAISNFFEENLSVLSKLNEKQKNDFLNFEGNAQGFRLLSRKESELDVTHNVLAAFTKYPRESLVADYKDKNANARKDQKKYGFFQSEKNLFVNIATEFNFHSLTNKNDIAFARSPLAFLVEAADDICYTIMDIEDGVRLNILPFAKTQELLMPILKKSEHNDIIQRCSKLSDDIQKIGYLRAKVINELTRQCSTCFMKNLTEIENGTYSKSLITEIHSAEIVNDLKELAQNKLYNYQPVAEIETAGFEIIRGLLEIILDLQKNPSTRQSKQRALLFPAHIVQPDEHLSHYEKLLHATDFVSGLTDGAAINLFNKIRGVSFPRIY